MSANEIKKRLKINPYAWQLFKARGIIPEPTRGNGLRKYYSEEDFKKIAEAVKGGK
jgi:DNA-binding transcriptional MerR regulator